MILKNDIKGNKTCLRTAVPDDAEYTLLLRKKPELNKYVHKLHGTIEDQKNWIKAQMEKEDSYFFVAADESGKLLGTTSVYDINKEDKFGITGRTVLEGNQIQNLEIIYLLYYFSFETLGLETIRTEVFEENLPAIGVTERFGGVCTGSHFNESFGLKELTFIITKDKYLEKKRRIVYLLERFVSRL